MKYDVINGAKSLVARQGDGLYTVIYLHPLSQVPVAQNDLTYMQLTEHPYVDKLTLALIRK